MTSTLKVTVTIDPLSLGCEGKLNHIESGLKYVELCSRRFTPEFEANLEEGWDSNHDDNDLVYVNIYVELCRNGQTDDNLPEYDFDWDTGIGEGEEGFMKEVQDAVQTVLDEVYAEQSFYVEAAS